MKFWAKLTDRRGETLVELMAAILIGTLAIALLFGGISAAGRVDLSMKELDADYYAGLSAAEMQRAEAALAVPVRLKISNPDNGMSKELDIAVYGDEVIYSYALKTNP